MIELAVIAAWYLHCFLLNNKMLCNVRIITYVLASCVSIFTGLGPLVAYETHQLLKAMSGMYTYTLSGMFS